jgi:hypothetical protein
MEGGLPNEELTQRGYYTSDGLRGDPFGLFESFQLGATNLATLVKGGLLVELPESLTFPFRAFKAPKKPGTAKPDHHCGLPTHSLPRPNASG